MKRLIILFIAVSAFTILNAQTLRMTTVHIDEQKEIEVAAKNNHIVGGWGGSTRVKEHYYEYGGFEKHRDKIIFLYISYYKTDILLDNKLGFYGFFSLDDNALPGVVGGVTYKVVEKNTKNRLFITGGLGFDFDSNFKIEVGALLSLNRFDLRLTTGNPDFISIGAGFNF